MLPDAWRNHRAQAPRRFLKCRLSSIVVAAGRVRVEGLVPPKPLPSSFCQVETPVRRGDRRKSQKPGCGKGTDQNFDRARLPFRFLDRRVCSATHTARMVPSWWLRRVARARRIREHWRLRDQVALDPDGDALLQKLLRLCRRGASLVVPFRTGLLSWVRVKIIISYFQIDRGMYAQSWWRQAAGGC